MNQYHVSKHKSFYVIGLSYKKADADMRGLFSISSDKKEPLLLKAQKNGIEELMIISTCNRTEIYGFAEHPFQLIQLICEFSRGNIDDFQKVGYVYKNKEAISHIFRVGTGLDSQILGDFEIIGQIKKSFTQSRKFGLANAFFERLINAVIQASKRVKNETELSCGATSVAFAAVQYILNNITDVSTKNILLFGIGKIGRNTCENLIKHTENKHITLINRTKDRADKIGGKFNLVVKEYSELQQEINKTDILVVATGAKSPTITRDIIPEGKEMVILDLSIPKNVNENVCQHKNVTLVHMDYLSQITDETLERRKKFVPQAEKIITEIQNDFNKWLENRKFAPTIKALKEKLSKMKDAEIDYQRKKISDFNDAQAEIISNRIIQKITTHFANHLRENNAPDESISLVQQIFQLEEL